MVCTSKCLVPLVVVILASKVTPICDDIALIELAFAVIKPSLKACQADPSHLLITLSLPVSIHISPIDSAVGAEDPTNVCTEVGDKGTH